MFQNLQSHFPGCQLQEIRRVGGQITYTLRNRGGMGATKAPEILENPAYTNTLHMRGVYENLPACTQTLRGEGEELRFLCVGTEVIFRKTQNL